MTPMNESNEQLFLAIGRLEGKMDSLIALKQKLEEQVLAQDERLRSLEHSRSSFFGVTAAIGAVVSAGVAFLTRYWTN